MKQFRFGIAAKLSVGFGLLLIAVLATIYLTYTTLNKNVKANSVITETYTPSASYLHDLHFLVTNSKMLIKNWVHIEEKENTPDKRKLKKLHNEDYPRILNAMSPLVEHWNETDRQAYFSLVQSIDSLFAMHKDIMQKLNTFDSYKDPMVMFEVIPAVEEGGNVIELTDRILTRLNALAKRQETIVKESNQEMKKSFAEFEEMILLMGLVLLIGIVVIAFFTTLSIVRPINHIKRIILKMGKGILPEKTIKSSNDEIGEMLHALNVLVQGLRSISKFSLEIGQGNFTSDFEALSKDDVLGNSLLVMRKNLKKASEEVEKRKKEDYQRNWISQGQAKFADLLRQSSDDITEFSFTIIKNIVKYLDANQGGLFIINDSKEDEPFIELIAAFAYDRRKMLEKRFKIGEGLIGRCIQENETIYLTEIPNDYIHITSGLGEDNPCALLLVPLIANETTYGVIEVASFNELKAYEIQFVEKIAEGIAATILGVRVNINTAKLLQESQEKSEKLAEQEEEMRQTMEEMQAQQEQMVKTLNQEAEQQKQEYEERIVRLEQDCQSQKESLQHEVQRLKRQLFIS